MLALRATRFIITSFITTLLMGVPTKEIYKSPYFYELVLYITGGDIWFQLSGYGYGPRFILGMAIFIIYIYTRSYINVIREIRSIENTNHNEEDKS